MTSPALSPIVPFYATVQPYITVDEFLTAPTGVDTSQLVPAGNTEENTSALQSLIARASGWADEICLQVLAATVDMQAGEFRVDRQGMMRVPVDNTPIVQVLSVSLGASPASMTPLTDLSGVWLGRKVVTIPVPAMAASFGALSQNYGVTARPGFMFAQVLYVNGYPNSALAAPVVAGAMSVQLTSTVGVLAGMPLTVFDDDQASTEPAVVSPGYAGGATVPLAAPLQSAHAAGTSVSALPRAIKQAVIWLVAALVKTRGAEPMSMTSAGGGGSVAQPKMTGNKKAASDMDEVDKATALLANYVRVT